ncbi:MAG: efflux RND transporter permease subunit [Candidatus Ozemobacteraceae bacterium]
MNWLNTVIHKPIYSFVFWLLIVIVGFMGFFGVPRDLFPDTVPPQVAVVTVMRGASAEDVNRLVTMILDREIKGISGLKNVTATSKDEISSINAEFEFEKNLGEAVNDVITAVSKAKRQFPPGVDEPQIFRITEANRPLLTMAVRAKDPKTHDLIAVRQIVENDIKEEILRLPGIGRVDVFGAHEAEVSIRFDHNRLREYDLTPEGILFVIGASNISVPGGYQETPQGETLVRTLSEAVTPQQLAQLPIRVSKGGILRLADVASVSLSMKTPRSIYHGDGEPAIAMNVLKPEGGNSTQGILALKGHLPQLQRRFPHFEFSFTTDQQTIIDKNFAGMKNSVIEAIWLTMLIVFITLLEWRTACIVAVSIPLSFLTTLTYLFFSGDTLNMITLSGLIIAVGMVVDDSIVVVENVLRRLHGGESGETVVTNGTKEVIFSILGGTLTTVVVLVPLMFTGGYIQRTMRPLTITISTTLIGSFFASLTIVPIMLKWFFGHYIGGKSTTKTLYQRLMVPLEYVVNFLFECISETYLWLLRIALKVRVLVLIGCIVALGFTVKNAIPLVGAELMPRMDTGMLTIRLDLPPKLTYEGCQNVLFEVEAILKREPNVLAISSVMGAEPGQISFGAGGQLLQQAEIQVRLTTRDVRAQTIWQIMNVWREELTKVPNIVSASITEYGASPVSTTRSPIDVVLVGRDPKILDTLAEDMVKRLATIPGLRDLRRQWSFTKPETVFHPDLAVAAQLGLSPKRLGDFLQMVFSGRIGSKLKMEGLLDLPIRVDLGLGGRLWSTSLNRLFLMLPGQDVDLANLGTTVESQAATMLTRENLEQTLDIFGINVDRPLSVVAADVKKVTDSFPFPEGYGARMSGTPIAMAEANERRGIALMRGIIFLYVVLLLMFETWWHPLLIMSTIPLAVIWGFWGLVIFDKPMCLPAMSGFILLGGTIVKNAILLIDFTEQARLRGVEKRQALFDSVQIRQRPIFITTIATVIGLFPLTFERAVGLERLSPLGVVASFGLLGGTLMTLVIIPVLYDFVTDCGQWFKGLFSVAGKRSVSVGNTGAGGTVVSAGTTVCIVAMLLTGASGFALEMPTQYVTASVTVPVTASVTTSASMSASASTMQKTDTAGRGRMMSVQECLTASQKNSPLLESLETERLGALGARQEAGAAARPQIDAAGAYRQWDRKRVGMLGIAPTERQFYDQDLSEFRLTLRQLLWDGNQTQNRKEAATLNVKSKEAQLKRTRDEVAADVLANALGVFTAEALLKAADKTLDDIRATLVKIEAMEAVGRVPHVDVLRIQARVEEVLETRENFRQSRANILAHLSSIVGCPEAIGGLTPEGLPAFDAGLATDAELLVQIALEQRVDLTALRFAVDGARRLEQAGRSGKSPQLFFNATANRYGDRTGWGREIGFVGAEFQWTLEDGGRNNGKTTQAVSQRNAALAKLRRAELRVAEQVRTALANLGSSRIRMERNEANVKLAAEAFRIEQLKYEQGRGTVNDVLDAESAMFQAEGLLIRSRNELLAARIALDLAVR